MKGGVVMTCMLHRRGNTYFMWYRTRALALLPLLALAGCATETIFQSSFNASPVGTLPAVTQATGTAASSGAPGAVVIDGPLGTSNENWVRVSRPSEDAAPIGVFEGDFSGTRGDGHYGLLTVLIVSSDIVGNNAQNQNNGSASVDLRPRPPQFPAVLHLDFLPRHPPGQMIRFNDDPNRTCGTFPVDQPFTLSIGIDVSGADATASVALLGAGVASDNCTTIALPNSLRDPLGALQLWMGWPWRGHFDATDIVVTYKKT
jgi:hypothetical protein